MQLSYLHVVFDEDLEGAYLKDEISPDQVGSSLALERRNVTVEGEVQGIPGRSLSRGSRRSRGFVTALVHAINDGTAQSGVIDNPSVLGQVASHP